MSHDDPAASNATLAGPTAVRARSDESKRSMCQNSGSLRPSGSTLLSMMLQPISPRLSGEFSTQLDISCAAVRVSSGFRLHAVFAVSTVNSVTAIDDQPIHFVIRMPQAYGLWLRARRLRQRAAPALGAETPRGCSSARASSATASMPRFARIRTPWGKPTTIWRKRWRQQRWPDQSRVPTHDECPPWSSQ
jgi:hypothetical protein